MLEDVEEATDALSEITITRKSSDRRTALINLRVSEATDEEQNDNIAANGVKLKQNKSSSSLNSEKKHLSKPASSNKIVKKRRGRVVQNSYSESNCSSTSARSGEASNVTIGINHGETEPEENKPEEKKTETPTYDEVFQANTNANYSELLVKPSPAPSTNSIGSSGAIRKQSLILHRIKNYDYEFGEKLA